MYVGVGRRAAALLVDTLIGSVWSVPFLIATHGIQSRVVVAPDGTRTHSYFVSFLDPRVLLVAAVWIAYMTWFEATSGASLGKRALGIKVAREDGASMDVGAALARNLLRVVDGLFLYLVAAILVWTSPTRQRLGDRVAHTVVVRAAVGAEALRPAHAPPIPLGGPPVPPPPPAPGP